MNQLLKRNLKLSQAGNPNFCLTSLMKVPNTIISSSSFSLGLKDANTTYDNWLRLRNNYTEPENDYFDNSLISPSDEGPEDNQLFGHVPKGFPQHNKLHQNSIADFGKVRKCNICFFRNPYLIRKPVQIAFAILSSFWLLRIYPLSPSLLAAKCNKILRIQVKPSKAAKGC